MIQDREKLSRLHAELDPSRRIDIGALLRGAEEAIGEERFDDADAILSGALIVDPNLSTTWRLIGHLAEERGELEDAERAYRTAMELGHDEGATLELARLLMSIARFEESEALLVWLVTESESPQLSRTAEDLLQLIENRRRRLS
ncbi:MAG: hypothetical protein HY791_04225 [Deltaproteobacteria bacterium]|nr:hypothetical protein [Deltaproteobacteria bacterium]